MIRRLISRVPAGEACRDRVVEWMATAMILSYSGATFASPDTIERGAFRYLVDLGITPGFAQWGCLILGLVRASALYFNGRALPWSARVRAACAVAGSIIFANMALALVFLTQDSLTWSLGVGTYVILALVEIYSCLRAGVDANERPRGDTGA